MAGDIYYQLLSENKQYRITIESQYILVSELKRRISIELGHKEELGIYRDQEGQREYGENEKISVHTKVLVERKQSTGMNGNYYGASKFLKCDKCGAINPSRTQCCGKKVCKLCKDESRRIGKCIFCGLTQQQSDKQLQLKNETLRRIKDSLNLPSDKEYLTFLENARFFFIRSCNQENITFALQHSIWATTLKNERILSDALQKTPNVILIFGVNKTSYFQGVAKMVQFHDRSQQHKTPWKNTECIKLGDDFLVKWLRVDDINHSAVYDLKNALCQNEPLTSKPKDCQEIDYENGRKLCLRFAYNVDCEMQYQQQQPSQQQQQQQMQYNQMNNANNNYGNQYQAEQNQSFANNLNNSSLTLPSPGLNTSQQTYINNLEDKNIIQQQQQQGFQQQDNKLPQLSIQLNNNATAENGQVPKDKEIEMNGVSENIRLYNETLQLSEDDFFSLIEELKPIRERKRKAAEDMQAQREKEKEVEEQKEAQIVQTAWKEADNDDDKSQIQEEEEHNTAEQQPTDSHGIPAEDIEESHKDNYEEQEQVNFKNENKQDDMVILRKKDSLSDDDEEHSKYHEDSIEHSQHNQKEEKYEETQDDDDDKNKIIDNSNAGVSDVPTKDTPDSKQESDLVLAKKKEETKNLPPKPIQPFLRPNGFPPIPAIPTMGMMNPLMNGMNGMNMNMNMGFAPFMPMNQMGMMGMNPLGVNPAFLGQFGNQSNYGMPMQDPQMMGMMGMNMQQQQQQQQQQQRGRNNYGQNMNMMFDNNGNKMKKQPEAIQEQDRNSNMNDQDDSLSDHNGSNKNNYNSYNNNSNRGGGSSSNQSYNRSSGNNTNSKSTNNQSSNGQSRHGSKQSLQVSSNSSRKHHQSSQRSTSNIDHPYDDEEADQIDIGKKDKNNSQRDRSRNRSKERKDLKRKTRDRSDSYSKSKNNKSKKRPSESPSRKKRDRKS